MAHVIIVGGGTLYRRTVKGIKQKYGYERWSVRIIDGHEYFFQTVPRPLEEQNKMVEKGYDPRSSHVRYKEEHKGAEIPKKYPYQLWKLLNEGEILLKGKDLICDEKLIPRLEREINDLSECDYYVLQD